MKRVVVTGLGVVTSLGSEVEELFQNLLEAKSGIGPIESFDASNHATKIAAEVRDFPVNDYIEPKDLKKHDRFSQFAMVAASKAIDSSGLANSSFDPESVGIYLGSGIGGIHTLESTTESFQTRGTRGVSPFFISNLISNMAGGNIAIKYDFRGTNFCMVSACATGTHCLGEGYREIKMGRHEVMVVGGAESAITPITVAGFSNMKAMSRQNENPQSASCPYDLRRDGFVMGEGAGVLVLESLDHAKKRGAKILAEVIGYGSTCDAHHITAVAPGGEGVARATKIALKDACIEANCVDYVNSHGTSTPIGDKYETEFLKAVFGDHAKNLWISSSKSMIGHLLGAAGGVESVISVMSLVKNAVHPTRNLFEPDPECDLDYVPNEAREKKLNVVLKNSMGFGGQNASVLFKRFE